MTIIEQARELLAFLDRKPTNEQPHFGLAALCRALIARDEALERIIGMCDCDDGNIGRCSNCGRPNGIPAIVACAERALTDDGKPREG